MKKCIALIFCFLFLLMPVHAEEGYDLIYPYENEVARVVRDQKWGLINESGEEVLTPSWSYIGELCDGLRLVMKNTLFGYIDVQNKTVITPSYPQAEPFGEGVACVKNEEGLWGFIDRAGNTVIPFTYELANSFSDSLALVKQDGLYGYINAQNELMVPCIYEEAYPFSEGLACVKADGLYGYIDNSGSFIIAPQFSLAFDFAEGGAVVKTDTGYGLIDSSGTFLIAPSVEHASPFLEGGLLKVKKGSKMALMDTLSTLRTDYLYEDIGTFGEGLFPAKVNGAYGYINGEGKTVIPHEWDTAGAFSEGLAPVSKCGFYGYINQDGQPVTEFIYADALTVKNGLGAMQTLDGKWTFISVSADSAPVKTESTQMLLLQIGNPHLMIQDTKIELEAPPVLENGYTLLPIRAVIEALGGTVGWNEQEEKISLSLKNDSVVLRLGEKGAVVNGKMTLMDIAPTIVNGRTMVPLRFILESFNCTINWNSGTQEILIFRADS